MKLRYVIVIALALIGFFCISYQLYELQWLDFRQAVTLVIVGVIVEVVAGIIGYLLGRRRKVEEIAKAIAEESQKLKEKEEVIKKHTNFIYNEIVRLLGKYSDFVALGDWLSCPNPDARAQLTRKRET